MEFTSVKEVKNLHHHEYVKDKCEMPRVNFGCLKCCFIIVTSIYLIETPATDSASHDTIQPLVFRMTYKDTCIIRVRIFRNK